MTAVELTLSQRIEKTLRVMNVIEHVDTPETEHVAPDVVVERLDILIKVVTAVVWNEVAAELDRFAGEDNPPLSVATLRERAAELRTVKP